MFMYGNVHVWKFSSLAEGVGSYSYMKVVCSFGSSAYHALIQSHKCSQTSILLAIYSQNNVTSVCIAGDL